MDRALRPYPPILVTFEGSFAPANVTNSSPIVVVWKKRDRRNTVITFPTAADEAVESGTEYVVQYGPTGTEDETVLGSDTDTTGSFNLDFKGFNKVRFFARRDGHESQAFTFDTIAANGDGASVAGALGTVAITQPVNGHVEVSAVGALPTVHVLFAESAAAAGNLGTLDVSVIEGAVSVGPASADIGSVALLAISGSASGGAEGDATGDIGTVTLSGVEGSVAAGADIDGDIGTVGMTATTGVGGVQADAAGDIGEITMTAPLGSAMGSTAVTNQEYMLPLMGLADLDTTGGQYMLPLGGAIHDE